MLNLHSPIFHEISVPNRVRQTSVRQIFLDLTKTRPFPAAPISPIPPDDDIQLNRRQHATSAEFAFFPSWEFRSVWRGRLAREWSNAPSPALLLLRCSRKRPRS